MCKRSNAEMLQSGPGLEQANKKTRTTVPKTATSTVWLWMADEWTIGWAMGIDKDDDDVDEWEEFEGNAHHVREDANDREEFGDEVDVGVGDHDGIEKYGDTDEWADFGDNADKENNDVEDGAEVEEELDDGAGDYDDNYIDEWADF